MSICGIAFISGNFISGNCGTSIDVAAVAVPSDPPPLWSFSCPPLAAILFNLTFILDTDSVAAPPPGNRYSVSWFNVLLDWNANRRISSVLRCNLFICNSCGIEGTCSSVVSGDRCCFSVPPEPREYGVFGEFIRMPLFSAVNRDLCPTKLGNRCCDADDDDSFNRLPLAIFRISSRGLFS